MEMEERVETLLYQVPILQQLLVMVEVVVVVTMVHPLVQEVLVVVEQPVKEVQEAEHQAKEITEETQLLLQVTTTMEAVVELVKLGNLEILPVGEMVEMDCNLP
jgi:hypothetical protein